MIITLIGLLIGIAILCAGLFYRSKEKADPESAKIYTIAAVVGLLIALVATVRLYIGF